MRLLVVDTETSGLDYNENGILTIGGAIVDDGAVVDCREYQVPLEVWHTVDPKAMEVNGIDLSEHATHGLNCTEVLDVWEYWVESWFKNGKVQLVGHNLAFDREFIRAWYSNTGSKPKFDTRYSYRLIDTMSIAAALKLAGKLDLESLSLDSLLKHYGIAVNKRHTALGDAVATAELLTKLVEDIRGEQSSHYC